MADEKDIESIRFIDSAGGTLRSSVYPTATCTVPQGALQNELNFIPVSIQVINVDKNLVQESLGKGSAISPILTIEPFRRKFHKPIELLLPIPGHDDYKVDANKLKILFSLSPSNGDNVEFEDITGNTCFNVCDANLLKFSSTCTGRIVIVSCTNSIIDVSCTMNDLYRKTVMNACTKESDSVTKMFQAAKSGEVSLLLEAISTKDVDVNHQNQEGQTALHLACKEGHIDIVKELLQRDAKCNLLSKRGNTPLHLACYYNRKDVVEILLNSGVDVNIKSKGGYPPIYAAILESHCDIVQLLISKSADTSWASPDGLSPILLALFSKVGTMNTNKELMLNTMEVLKDSLDQPLSAQLKERGFKNHGEALLRCVHIKTNKFLGNTVVENIRQKLANLSCKFLQEDIASIELAPDDLKKCLKSVMENDIEQFEVLLSTGFDINSVTERSVTVLHVACLHGHQKIVELILDRLQNSGASQGPQRLDRSLILDKQTQGGFTGLYLAAQEGYKDIVALLLIAGASGKLISNFGLSPSDIAILMSHQEVATVIRNTWVPRNLYENRTSASANNSPAVSVNKRNSAIVEQASRKEKRKSTTSCSIS